MDADLLVKNFERDGLVSGVKKLQVKQDLFDLSILENHPELNDETNKTVLGKIKINTPKTVDIIIFAALRTKARKITCDNEEDNKKKLKAYTKEAMKNINFNKIKDCLYNILTEQKNITNNVFVGNDHHELFVQSTFQKNNRFMMTKTM